MGAISTSLLAVLSPGDHVIASTGISKLIYIVGLEDVADLRADTERALAEAGTGSGERGSEALGAKGRAPAP